MAKAPTTAPAPRTARTAPMPANMTNPPKPSSVEPIEAPAEEEVDPNDKPEPTEAELADAAETPEGKEAARQAAEAANQKAAKEAVAQTEKIVANAKVEPLSPATAFPGQTTVTMVAPRAFYVLLDDGRRVQFKKGPQEVCEGLQEHHYVKANGVELYSKA